MSRSASTQKLDEAAAVAALDAVCANPPVDPAKAILAAASAYSAVAKTIAAARGLSRP
jgi:hypothetical protein